MSVTTLPFRITLAEAIKVSRDVLYRGDSPWNTYGTVGFLIVVLALPAVGGFYVPLLLAGVFGVFVALRDLHIVVKVRRNASQINGLDYTVEFSDEMMSVRDNEGRSYVNRLGDFGCICLYPPNLVLHQTAGGSSFIPLRVFQSPGELEWVIEQFRLAGARIVDKRKQP